MKSPTLTRFTSNDVRHRCRIKREFVAVLVLLGLIPVPGFGSITGKIDVPVLVASFTVFNDSASPVQLVRVGVESRLLTRQKWDCLDIALPVPIAADYRVDFHVADKHTLKAADPPLDIPSKGTARFTVSLYPDATGACGPWTAQVWAVAKFTDGKTSESQRATISDRDLATMADNRYKDMILHPTQEEIREYLIDQPNLTLAMIPNLKSGKDIIPDALRYYIEDQREEHIVISAIALVGTLKIKELIPTLKARYGSRNDEEVNRALCQALVQLDSSCPSP